MARTKISEFSSTAADNTDIDGIDIAEGCAPSGINNAIRTLMADLKDMQTGASGDTFTFASLNATTANIDGGTIDGATIGGSSAAAVSSTNLAYTGTLTGGTGVINIGSGQLYKDASGNVGIGTSSPSYRLHLNSTGSVINYVQTTSSGSGNTASWRLRAATYEFGAYVPDNANALVFYDYGQSTERMRLDSSGNVGIGTSSPVNRLTVAESNNSSGVVFIGNAINTSNAEYGRIRFGSIATNGVYVNYGGQIASFSGGGIDVGDLRFYTAAGAASTERMRIDSSGNLLVNTTGQRSAGKICFDINGSINAGIVSYPLTNGNIDAFRFLNNAGSIVGLIQSTPTATSYVTSSDYRLKEQVAPMTGALAKNELLNPVTYKWKADGSDGQGFIAHELQAVFPDAVTGEKDAVDDEGKPVYQGVDTSFLVGHLVACVKELTAELNNVKAELAAMKGSA